MNVPSFADSFEVLCLIAADDGRKDVLFGDSFDRVLAELPPFLVGKEFPDTYFEFPLIGDPFLDVTMLYGELDPHTRIESAATADTGAMFDWYAEARKKYDSISCGFEFDTKNPELPAAAIHFQPRDHTELVKPFCDTIGEPDRAELYLSQAARMPEEWPLSFFGMFRGRPGSPLRICGYLGNSETTECIQDPQHLTHIFDETGFSAYNDAMLSQIRQLMQTASESLDFQFDVYPDGGIGDTFAIDLQFKIQQPAAVRSAFSEGIAARCMQLLQNWGAADDRWKLGAETAFARAIPVSVDGKPRKFGFTLMPQWVKARWRNGVLQPSKLYLLGNAGLITK